MTRAALTALLSHWRRHPGQALTLILGLALATALWTGVQAINSEARASYDRAATALGQNDLPRLVPASGDTLPLAEYAALRRAGWAVAPVIEGRLRADGARVTLIGLDPLAAPAIPNPDAGAPADPGAALADFLLPPGELRAHPETLARLASQGYAPRPVPTTALAQGTAVTDIGTAAVLLDMPDRLTRLVLLAEPAPDLPLLDTIAPGLVRTEPTGDSDIRGLTGSFHLNLTAFGFLSFAVGLFIVHGAVGLAFEQRRGTIRTLRALGLPLGRLMRLMAVEALVLALVGGTIGVALGYALAAALLPDVAATLRGLYGAPVAGTLSIRPEWWLAGFAIAVLGTILATAQSFWQLTRLPILAPARPRAWALASARQQRGMAALGAALLVVALVATLAGSGLTAGFTALAGLLLGAALLLPLVLSGLLTLGARMARRPVAEWLWADARQQVPGLSLALMALLLALSANIGVATMVASFRATFDGWLDRRLSSQVYVDFGDAETAAAALPWLRDRTTAQLPISNVEADLGGAPGLVYGMADHPVYRSDWPLIAAVPRVWDRLAAGEGMLINEQWGHRDGLRPGDIAMIDGKPREVLGLYADYGNPRPQAMLGLDTYLAAYPSARITRYALRADPSEAAALTAEIIDRFDLRPDQATDQESLKAVSRSIFERTFAATDALNLLTLGVAAFAMLTSLLTLQTLRLPQVAPLWALGLTRAGLARLDLLRTGLMALATAVMALPVGLALAWLLLARVNVAAFGWRLPMQTFPADWALLIAAAVAAALLAAALPAWRLRRTPPARLLEVFAHER